jgi:hypothetical protein
MLTGGKSASLLVNLPKALNWTGVNFGPPICLAANIPVRSRRPSDDGAQQSVIPAEPAGRT